MIDLRPKKLDWYIFKKFMTTFFIAMILIIVIVIIFDISEKIDKFVANEAPLRAIIFDYYVNFVPYFMNMFSPLFVFITVIFFTSKMAADSEIIAILSGGVSYHRMLVPYMASAVIIAILSLSLNLFVIPRANKERLIFENQYVKNRNEYNRDIHYQIDTGKFVYVESFTNWNNTAYRFTLEDIQNNKLHSKITAETAQWDTTFNGWVLNDYFIRTYIDGMEDQVVTGSKLDTVINLTVSDFYRNKKTVETLQYDELNDLIATQKMRGDANHNGSEPVIAQEKGRNGLEHSHRPGAEFLVYPVYEVQRDVRLYGGSVSRSGSVAAKPAVRHNSGGTVQASTKVI